MDSILDNMRKNFGLGAVPYASEIIIWDGYDQLDKRSAALFYSGKSWFDVLTHLRNLKYELVFGAAYYLEDWQFLSHIALPYYARAHLEFLFETLEDEEPDDDFVFQLFSAWYQVIYIHKGSPFSLIQTELLRRVGHDIIKITKRDGVFEDSYIEANARKFLAELEKYAS